MDELFSCPFTVNYSLRGWRSLANLNEKGGKGRRKSRVQSKLWFFREDL